MKTHFVLLIALFATAAPCQQVTGQSLDAIAQAAQDAMAKADAALAAASFVATPPVCSATPASDTLMGTTGTATPCLPRPDNTRPTPVQAINTTLAADCTWAVTFARATTSASPIVHASVKLAAGATQPIPCSPIAISSTAASGKCFPAQATPLAAVTVVGISVAVGSQVINPTASTCTAGMTVMVNVREPTQ